MPGRAFNAGSYRFGFNGMEQDDEVSGSGNQYDYGFRIYNPRLGRFLSIDPLSYEYPWNSPYAFSENRLIDGIELEGLEFWTYMDWQNDMMAGLAFGAAYIPTKILTDQVVDKTYDGIDDLLHGTGVEKPTNDPPPSILVPPWQVSTIEDSDPALDHPTALSTRPDDWDSRSIDSKISWLKENAVDSDDVAELEMLKKEKLSNRKHKRKGIGDAENLEEALNQLDGLREKQDRAKKEKRGSKQRKVENIQKSEDRVQYHLDQYNYQVEKLEETTEDFLNREN